MRPRKSLREQVVDQLFKIYFNYKKKVIRVCNREFSKEITRTYNDIIKWQKKRISEIFNEAVDKFYSSYPPNLYDRQGDPSSHTGGLYELLSMDVNESGTSVFLGDNYMGLFDESRMHGDRHGGSLFEKVFIEGWHGGAESGPGHPDPGTPYWRTPAPDYTEWFKTAAKKAKDKDIPYNIIVKKINAMYKGREKSEYYMKAYELAEIHFNIAMEKIVKKI